MPSKMNVNSLSFDKRKDSSGNIMGVPINIQTFQYRRTDDQYIDYTTDTTVANLTMNYTPLYANSKLIVRVTMGTRSNGTGRVGMAIRLLRDGSVVNTIGATDGWGYSGAFYYKSDTVNHHRQLHLRAVVNANSTATTTFAVRTNVSWGAFEYSTNWGLGTIQVMELQQ